MLSAKSAGIATESDCMGGLIGKTGLDFSVTLSLPLPVSKRLLCSANVKIHDKIVNQTGYGYATGENGFCVVGTNPFDAYEGLKKSFHHCVRLK